MTIVPEVSRDFDGVRALLTEAFGRPQEAALVDALRRSGRLAVGLAGFDRADQLAGFVALSPVGVEGAAAPCAGLGPVAVLSKKRKKGFGSALVRAGLRAAAEKGFGAAFVLGEPEFYGRFGFVPAAKHGLACEYGAPAEYFLALELSTGALKGAKGVVRYAPEFEGCA